MHPAAESAARRAKIASLTEHIFELDWSPAENIAEKSVKPLKGFTLPTMSIQYCGRCGTFQRFHRFSPPSWGKFYGNVAFMSGHSKWSSIKHKKAITDSKRGRVFTKLIKEITIAARLGGGDINGNPRLRTAVTVAKQQSMPNDNIDRAIKKGTGELGGAQLDEITYEGYGPAGVAIMVDVLSDNRNRTVAEL